MMLLTMLACLTLCRFIRTASTSNSYSMQTQVGLTYQPTAYPPQNTSQYVPPTGPSYPSANTSQYPSPSAPSYPSTQHVSSSVAYNPTTNQPSHIHVPPSASLKPEDNAPSDLPSYETAIAANYIVPRPAPSGEPAKESKTAPVP